jgi:serine phosphatase RsbU (regulator of sigma subunit)
VGTGPVSALAARMARDELVRALNAGANARKALSHTNRVLHKQLPKGACACACLLSLQPSEIKLYQAGFRPPLLVCAAGRVKQSQAEGLALGLDDGPVFEKGLRSTAVPVSQGVRVVLANEGAHRLEDLARLVAEHSPKHTTPFMNLVLSALEGQAGESGLREDVVLLTAKRW